MLLSMAPLTVLAADGHTHALSADGETVEFAELPADTTKITAAGSYYLTQDIELTSEFRIEVEGAVNLCLNGHSITATADNSNDVVIFIESGTLNLCDCQGGGCITSAEDLSFSGVTVWSGAVFNMYGGEIKDNAYYAVKGANFNMYGGEIKNNKGEYAGGIYIENNGGLNIKAGKIIGNSASIGNVSSTGGGIGFSTGSVVLSGADIQIKDNVNTATSPSSNQNVAKNVVFKVAAPLDPAKTQIAFDLGEAVFARPDGTNLTTLSGMEKCFISPSEELFVVCNEDGELETIYWSSSIKEKDGDFVVTVSADSGVTYQWYQADGEELTMLEGETAAELKIAEFVENYACEVTFADGTTEMSDVFENIELPAPVVAAPTANTLTYNGSAQELITAGSADGGEMQYSLDGEAYSADIPTATNAGEYTVYYKVVGDANHNDTVAETVTVTIGKKNVSVSATVPDRIYGEHYEVDTSKVVITFDGIVEGDDVGYVVTDAYYHVHTVTDNAPVQVDYNVNGADADNYQFPEFGDYLAPDYGVEATGRVLPRDIANAEITLGDALVYNGTEQTQTVAAVTVDGLEVTYTVSGNKATNVGIYELTITGNGNFTGTKTALYKIAPDTAAIDDLTVDNVKSSDKEAIEAVAQQIENAVTDLAEDETKAEYKAIADKCDELLKKIDENENQVGKDEAAEKAVAEIGAELEMFDENRVTKFWEDDIEALKAKIDELLADENMGETEKAKLNEYKAQAEKLIEIINTPKEYFSLRFFYLIWD